MDKFITIVNWSVGLSRGPRRSVLYFEKSRILRYYFFPVRVIIILIDEILNRGRTESLWSLQKLRGDKVHYECQCNIKHTMTNRKSRGRQKLLGWAIQNCCYEWVEILHQFSDGSLHLYIRGLCSISIREYPFIGLYVIDLCDASERVKSKLIGNVR